MVSIDPSGTPVRISGAALAGGPLLVLSPARRLQDLARASAGTGRSFPAEFRQAIGSAGAAQPTGEALALRPEALPVRWGIPAFFGGAPFGPPYELENRTTEWALSRVAREAYGPSDRQARMAQRVHPKGPALTDGRAFFAALYETAPAPPSLGVGLDAVR